MPDALTLLKQDHLAVEELFQRFEHLDAQGLDTAREVVAEIVRELSIHAAIEEQIFYPAVRASVPDGDPLSEHLRHEHQEVKELLARLEGTDPGTPAFAGTVQTVMANVRAHVREEEGQVFPRIAETLDASTLEEMGRSLERAKKTAPTHPHPNAPSIPPANLVAGPPTAALDRVRDAPRGRKVALLAAAAGVLALVAWRTTRRRGE